MGYGSIQFPPRTAAGYDTVDGDVFVVEAYDRVLATAHVGSQATAWSWLAAFQGSFVNVGGPCHRSRSRRSFTG